MKLRFNVYDPDGTLVAKCKHPEDAAAVIANYGAGSQLKDSATRIVLWTEGRETHPAAESYDAVAITSWARINAHLEKLHARYIAAGLIKDYEL